MTGPAAFERLVASDFEARGYQTRITGGTSDWGVDIFASKGEEKIAIQAKMYAGARPVNRRQVFELYGAAAYFDCTGSVIATDGVLAGDAAEAAGRLGVLVMQYGVAPTGEAAAAREQTADRSPIDFDAIWERSILPLTGRTLSRADGSTNVILAADWAGVTRVSSGGNAQRIPIETFRWAIERVLEFGVVTREEINSRYEGRASSGIVLILAEVPEFIVGGRPLSVSLRRPVPQ
jgi:hypothetical protein